MATTSWPRITKDLWRIRQDRQPTVKAAEERLRTPRLSNTRSALPPNDFERRSDMFVTTDEVQLGSQAGGAPASGLAQMPPAPPTTVAVIESIATGAPSRIVYQSEA